MKIHEAARLTGVTVRTLHYYDEIGLLSPSEITKAGYRLYDDAALATLQQILFFRELDFPLNEIKEIMTNSAYNRAQALAKHKELLLKKCRRLNRLIELVDKTLKGDDCMSFQEFDNTEVEQCKQAYTAEVKLRWGGTAAYAQSQETTGGYGEEEWQQINTLSAEIMEAFAQNRGKAPGSPPVQALVGRWQAFITAKFYNCTTEILACLGQMYVGDERFTENIDRHGAGTAALMAKAIEIYCAK